MFNDQYLDKEENAKVQVCYEDEIMLKLLCVLCWVSCVTDMFQALFV